MISYETKTKASKVFTLDRTKRNVLIIGQAESNNRLNTIVNPIDKKQALSLYGDSDLYNAYASAVDITNDINIYTMNCLHFTDFIKVIDELVHYNFDFIAPVNINFRDTFINPITSEITYFSSYYLDRLGQTNNKTILIMSDYESSLYENIDSYIGDMKKIYDEYERNNLSVLNSYGSNLIFVLNNLLYNKFSNVILAALLSICEFSEYPQNITQRTYFDIDYSDLRNYNSLCFFKYHPAGKVSSVEQLYNLKLTDDIYKKVIIDMVVKEVTSRLDLTEFNGMLYSPYTKVKIDVKVEKIMNEMAGEVFSEYKINSIAFKKTGIGVGYLIVDISITPYGLLDKINILMEV